MISHNFILAIVGRPNVGKSTLFNRLVGRKLALVDDQPGVTRDRRFGDAKLGDLRFQIIDTAGFEEGKSGSLEARMRAQTEAAIAEADMVLMLTDARVGILPEDELFARLLRKACSLFYGSLFLGGSLSILSPSPFRLSK